MNLESETLRLLRLWKMQEGIQTDAEASRRLGITRSAINNWRHRGSHAEARTIMKMCEALKEDLAGSLGRLLRDCTRHAA